MKTIRLSTLLASAALALGAISAQADVVQFENITPGFPYLLTSGPDNVDGMTFTYGGSAYFMQNYHSLDARAPVDPTGSLFTYSGYNVNMTQQGGSPFSLNSFDAGIYLDTPSPATISLLGSVHGGGTVTAAFSITPNDWTTFVLDGSWSNLDSVSFQMDGSYYIQYDNIVYNASVPEGGATLALLGLGLSVVAVLRRSRAV